MNDEIVAIGFDPGLATTGYGVVRAVNGGWEAVAGGVIHTERGHSRARRLLEIYHEAQTLLEIYFPHGVAIEEVFFATNARTAMRTAETRGVLLLAAAEYTVRGYTPLQVKKRITGYGKAPKQQVQAMVKRLLDLSDTPKPDDIADGLALALCFLLEQGGVSPTDDVYL